MTIKGENVGAALARIRWAKATPEEKAEQARKMVAGRAKARKAKGKKR